MDSKLNVGDIVETKINNQIVHSEVFKASPLRAYLRNGVILKNENHLGYFNQAKSPYARYKLFKKSELNQSKIQEKLDYKEKVINFIASLNDLSFEKKVIIYKKLKRC